MKPHKLDATEQHIVDNATRFYVTSPASAFQAYGHHNPPQRLMTCYHFSLAEACEYALWIQNTIPQVRNRVLVYAAQCDHPEAPTPSQQWRSVLVPREHWV